MQRSLGDPSPRGRRHRRSRTLRLAGLAILLACALVAGLGLLLLARTRPSPLTGQVLATVGGQEVTEQDLAAEAQAEGRPDALSDRSRLLDTVITRLLLAQAAHARGLDRAPTYPAARALAESQLLAEQLIRRTRPADPNEGELLDYIAAHPYAFADRMTLTLDKLTWINAPNGGGAQGSTVDDLRNDLARSHIPFQSEQLQISSDSLEPSIVRRLQSQPPGSIVRVQEGSLQTALSQIQFAPAPLAGAVASTLARRLLAQDQQRSVVSELAATLRRQIPVRLRRDLDPVAARAPGAPR